MANKFNNVIQFRGSPYVPVSSEQLRESSKSIWDIAVEQTAVDMMTGELIVMPGMPSLSEKEVEVEEELPSRSIRL